MIRAIIIASNPIIREGVRGLLARSAVHVLAVCRSAEEGIRQVRSLAPDVAFVASDPTEAGLALLGALRNACASTAIILLGQREGDGLVQAMQQGAASFLSQNASRQSLLLAAEAALQGYALIDQAALRGACADPGAPRPSPGGDGSTLTSRERQVLELLSGGLSNREIAGRLAISAGTVRAHLSSIYGKLKVTDRVQAAVWAADHGLRAPSPEPALATRR